MLEAPSLDTEELEDLDEAPDAELEAAEEEILDAATAAQTLTELKAEIVTLKHLEELARAVRQSGTDTKWRELASLLSEILSPHGRADEVAQPDPQYRAGVRAQDIPKPESSPHQKLLFLLSTGTP